MIPVASCVTDPNKDPVTVDLDSATGGTVQRVSGTWFFKPAPKSTAPGSFVMHATDDGGLQAVPVRVTVTIAADATPVTLVVANTKPRVLTRGLALRLSGVALDQAGKPRTISWDFGDKTPPASGANVAHRFRNPGTFFVTATASTAPPVRIKVMVRQPAVEVVGAPSVEDGVMPLRVRTRVAGKLPLRVDSRSQTISVPSGLTVQTLRIQVTTGPLVRLTLRLTPRKKTVLQALRMRQLVLVSPPQRDSDPAQAASAARTLRKDSSSGRGSASGSNQRSSATSSSGCGSPETSRHSKKALIVASPRVAVDVRRGQDQRARPRSRRPPPRAARAARTPRATRPAA